MRSSAEPRSFLNIDDLSQSDLASVLEHARTLRVAAHDGAIQPLLRGRNLALLCEADSGDEATLFRRAAVELGAHVAHVRPSLSEQSTPDQIRKTARMLGQLYDAMECQGIAAELVRQLGREAGVPVYRGLASPGHATAALVQQLDGDEPSADKRRFVLQAVLLGTIT